MMFTLTESILNGSVSMSSKVTLVEATNFEEACDKIRKLPNWNLAINVHETSEGFSYYIESGAFGCSGVLNRQPPEII